MSGIRPEGDRTVRGHVEDHDLAAHRERIQAVVHRPEVSRLDGLAAGTDDRELDTVVHCKRPRGEPKHAHIVDDPGYLLGSIPLDHVRRGHLVHLAIRVERAHALVAQGFELRPIREVDLAQPVAALRALHLEAQVEP